MKARYLAFAGLVVASASAMLGACATDEAGFEPPPPEPAPIPAVDAGSPDADAAADASFAAPCSDCEYFPAECSSDVLCPNGPFGTPDGIDTRTQLSLIRGRSATDVWVAGALGAVAHFDGTTWKREDVGTRESIRGLWLRDDSEVALVALDRPYSRGIDIVDGGAPSPGGWSLGNTPSSPANYRKWIRNLNTTWAAAGAQWLWGATDNTCTSSACLDETPPTNSPSGLWRFRVAPSSKFEIGDAVALDVCQRVPCKDMTSIHGIAADQFWAVGNTGAALRISNADSDTPSVEAFNTQTWEMFYGVWMASATEAWAVGTRGLVRHYTGDPLLWDIVTDVPATTELRAVFGSSPSDVWIVGDGALVLHYDGTSWSRVKIAGLGNLRPDLRSVWVPSPGHVWIGGQGVVLSLGGKP